MEEKKTITDALLNTVIKGSHFKTIAASLDEMVSLIETHFISKAKSSDELTRIYKCVTAAFFGGEDLNVNGGEYRLVARFDPRSILNRYSVSIYNGETEFRYKAFSRGKMKKAIKAKLDSYAGKL